MRAIRAIALAFATLPLAAPALAKDLCFADSFGNKFVIKKVKKLKRAAKLFPVTGYAVIPGNSYLSPLSGTAVANTNGWVTYGVRVHNILEGTDMGIAGVWKPDTGNMPTHFDSDGDGRANYSDFWSPIDCKTIVLP